MGRLRLKPGPGSVGPKILPLPSIPCSKSAVDLDYGYPILIPASQVIHQDSMLNTIARSGTPLVICRSRTLENSEIKKIFDSNPDSGIVMIDDSSVHFSFWISLNKDPIVVELPEEIIRRFSYCLLRSQLI
jgi:hypothetical protein